MLSSDFGPIRYEWRGSFINREVNQLHAEGFEHGIQDIDWGAQLGDHSLGWVTARDDRGLIGFVNIVWDGLNHAFVEDTLVAVRARGQRVGVRLIEVARARSSEAGCEWLHVDFEEHLKGFYFDACGFVPTNAGVIKLR